jgi:hypothetical protein
MSSGARVLGRATAKPNHLILICLAHEWRGAGREGDMYQLSCLDPSYKVHVNNLQEETPIIKVQRTRYSQGLEFLKHQAEQKRIEKEQEHIDGSWEERMIQAENERLEKVEAEWRAQSIKRKRVQEAEERAAKRRMGMGSVSRSSTAPLPSHDVCVKLSTCDTSSSISYSKLVKLALYPVKAKGVDVPGI